MSATDDNFTSKWGCIQSTGVLYVWARDRGGPYAGASWNANTEGRGSEYNAPNAALLGGDWGTTSNSGSRAASWDSTPWISDSGIGARFAAGHLVLG